MKRAIVIKTAGDTDIANAIVTGMTNGNANEIAALRAEIDAMRHREAALAVRVVRDRGYWREMLEDADDCYGYNPIHGGVYTAVWGIVGLVCETVRSWYDYFSTWNRAA